MLCGRIEVGGVSALHVLEEGRLSQLLYKRQESGRIICGGGGGRVGKVPDPIGSRP